MRMLILTAALLAVPTIGVADEIMDAVKARQEHMKARGQAMGALAKMAKGEVDYDAGAAQAAADKLVELVNTDTGPWWVMNSSTDDLPGETRALPALWTDGAKVGEVAGQMAPAAAALQQAAGQGKDEMAAALGGAGKVCTDCHKAYQQPKQ